MWPRANYHLFPPTFFSALLNYFQASLIAWVVDEEKRIKYLHLSHQAIVWCVMVRALKWSTFLRGQQHSTSTSNTLLEVRIKSTTICTCSLTNWGWMCIINCVKNGELLFTSCNKQSIHKSSCRGATWSSLWRQALNCKSSKIPGGPALATRVPLYSNGNAKKPFCRRLVNHFMDVLKQKIIGLGCTDLVLVPILQGAIPYTYSKAEIQWLSLYHLQGGQGIKSRILLPFTARKR